jgi:hypothetical protein
VLKIGSAEKGLQQRRRKRISVHVGPISSERDRGERGCGSDELGTHYSDPHVMINETQQRCTKFTQNFPSLKLYFQRHLGVPFV